MAIATHVVLVYHVPLQIATFWEWLAFYFHHSVCVTWQISIIPKTWFFSGIWGTFPLLFTTTSSDNRRFGGYDLLRCMANVQHPPTSAMPGNPHPSRRHASASEVSENKLPASHERHQFPQDPSFYGKLVGKYTSTFQGVPKPNPKGWLIGTL